ncbi:MAG: hypothetical protein JWN67_2491 [Actinomycetia bacterium]|nr:hypothetical protein [Actinomycetes bacterium]
MARRIREEIIDDDPVVVTPAPVTRRVVTERRSGPAMGGMGGMNPVAMALAAVLLVFILVLVFGFLL